MIPSTCCLDANALRAVEAAAADGSADPGALMERAGRAAWHAALAHWPQAQRIVVACGPGNNGGDGYAFARHARLAGREVLALRLPGQDMRTEIAHLAESAYADAGGRSAAFDDVLPACDLVVDALFGIGLSRAPDANVARLIDAINGGGHPVLSIDVPSGVDADRGAVPGHAVVATRTLQMMSAHPGLYTGEALDYAGARSVAALDLDPALFDGRRAVARVIARDALGGFLAPRRRNAHKGDGGRALCIGGDRGKGGALMLCAEAALRSGAGLVDAATRAAHVPVLLAHRAEIMAHDADDTPIERLIDAAGVIAIGPGLGQSEWGRRLWSVALSSGKPLVIDADALNMLAATPRRLPDDAILTPHPGEAARLLQIATRDVQADRYAAVHRLRDRYGGVVVLKGAGTLVASGDAIIRAIDAGNPGMAVGGMGDVLTGVIVALRAQRLSAFDAAVCGALLHGVAGDDAAADGGERGLLPSDLFPHLRRLANP